jgi:hypothetical protein
MNRISLTLLGAAWAVIAAAICADDSAMTSSQDVLVLTIEQQTRLREAANSVSLTAQVAGLFLAQTNVPRNNSAHVEKAR